jgi:hypothetical protein
LRCDRPSWFRDPRSYDIPDVEAALAVHCREIMRKMRKSDQETPDELADRLIEQYAPVCLLPRVLGRPHLLGFSRDVLSVRLIRSVNEKASEIVTYERDIKQLEAKLQEARRSKVPKALQLHHAELSTSLQSKTDEVQRLAHKYELANGQLVSLCETIRNAMTTFQRGMVRFKAVPLSASPTSAGSGHMTAELMLAIEQVLATLPLEVQPEEKDARIGSIPNLMRTLEKVPGHSFFPLLVAAPVP